jgi:hypothetical protein
MLKKLGENFRPVRSYYGPPLSFLKSSCPACHGDRDPSQRSARTETLKLGEELGLAQLQLVHIAGAVDGDLEGPARNAVDTTVAAHGLRQDALPRLRQRITPCLHRRETFDEIAQCIDELARFYRSCV